MNLLEHKVEELIPGADKSRWMVHSNHNIRCFTKSEVEIITNSYRTMIGRGGFGEVFQGVLEDRGMVAVKRFINNVKDEDFAKELIVHREINHKNVVKLIGYCMEENALMMITEFIPNGNLSDVLHRDSGHISLDMRLRIATECAEAMAYMHSYMYTQVIHGDIKPANILLDHSFCAKISDFGISRLVNTDDTLYTGNIKGSIGYLDPLFARDGCLTVKSDVYSFGVVLLELITRKKATTKVWGVSIIDLCTDALSRGMRGVFDDKIANQDNMNILEGVAKLAGDCLRMERDRRPEMIAVAERLRRLRNASLQGQKRRDWFSWAMKSLPPAPPSPELYRKFSYAEMKAATQNFDKSLLVGKGEFGRVYRGMVDGSGTNVVAIKCLKRRHTVKIQPMLRHHHLVPVIGYCDEDEMILVYEYMAHGSLRDHLFEAHNSPLTRKSPLSWKQRLEICIGAARGLHYLHTCAEKDIIHRNVKLTNILLDNEWVAKISDNIETDPITDTICNAHGNIYDPEYDSTGRLTEKSDVFSFGAVLLEVLCAQPFLGKDCLLHWAVRCKKEGNLHQIVDCHLKRKMDPHSLFKFVETCEKCLANRSIGRPSMADVIADLEYALQLQESAEAGSRAGDAINLDLEVDSNNKDSMAWWYLSTSSSGSS
ncbi:probable LRR receptor-like serine/threonine-protein kinase At1g06840 [Sorghum bicolor]|uniref:probable LRR receptor-like serine/threonine-protein kinase At1g06840 n=1 Tax=Sorghum bicolor TaxID=4558 RepID=UPI00081ABE3F|nr:probable LRR receptor-like serine/threonine-protein kinase At1g06840 [Sorghum bicolor]|eukprot:XP_002465198.2 probable LRR receptor-like serine/threonine-protein kinase At1g06840 [Sorghum bicolor]